MRNSFLTCIAIALAMAPVSSGCAQKANDVKFPAIDGSAVLQHTRVLASDQYEGRFPGSKREDLGVAYIEGQFRIVGYRVANADRYPQWKPGSEFKTRRDGQLEAAKQE